MCYRGTDNQQRFKGHQVDVLYRHARMYILRTIIFLHRFDRNELGPTLCPRIAEIVVNNDTLDLIE